MNIRELLNFVQKDNLEVLEIYLKEGNSADAKFRDNLTPLMVAALNNSVKEGASINCRCYKGMSALMYAADSGV